MQKFSKTPGEMIEALNLAADDPVKLTTLCEQLPGFYADQLAGGLPESSAPSGVHSASDVEPDSICLDRLCSSAYALALEHLDRLNCTKLEPALIDQLVNIARNGDTVISRERALKIIAKLDETKISAVIQQYSLPEPMTLRLVIMSRALPGFGITDNATALSLLKELRLLISPHGFVTSLLLVAGTDHSPSLGLQRNILFSLLFQYLITIPNDAYIDAMLKKKLPIQIQAKFAELMHVHERAIVLKNVSSEQHSSAWHSKRSTPPLVADRPFFGETSKRRMLIALSEQTETPEILDEEQMGTSPP